MPRRTRVLILVFALVAAAAVLMLLMPPAAVTTPPPPDSTVRGAYHVHSDRSDGGGTVDDIAVAAAAAELQFVILTDHGDGTRAPDPPTYRHGVLMLDAVELSTTAGHYTALGLPASPYPLAGTPEAVLADVARLGGFGLVAHPGSPRPALQWTAWDAPIDGLEWINGDSEWRDEPRLPVARVLLTYLFRAPESMAALLDRPEAVLDRWDALTQSRRVFTLAGLDAHARLGFQQNTDPDVSAIHVPLPGYEASFRTFSNHVVLDAPFSGNAADDARRLLDAIRGGRTYSVIDALATPGALSFTAMNAAGTAGIGDDLAVDGDVQLRAEVQGPPGTTIVLRRNGAPVHSATGVLELNGGRDAGVYRVEVFVANGPGEPPVPWMVSNPIYVGGPRPVPAAPDDVVPAARIPARVAEATAEQGVSDRSAVTEVPAADPRARRLAGEPPLAWSFALGSGAPAGQFAAVQVPVSSLAAFERVRFRVTASGPMRVWVQLRAPIGNTERWGTTFYADETERVIDLPLDAFLPIGVTSMAAPPLDRVESLLLVADTLNFLPGAAGSMVVSEVAFVR